MIVLLFEGLVEETTSIRQQQKLQAPYRSKVDRQTLCQSEADTGVLKFCPTYLAASLAQLGYLNYLYDCNEKIAPHLTLWHSTFLLKQGEALKKIAKRPASFKNPYPPTKKSLNI